MADATDSKSVVGDNVRVQVPPSAPNKKTAISCGPFNFYFHDISFLMLKGSRLTAFWFVVK